jgi:hypothetical protein
MVIDRTRPYGWDSVQTRRAAARAARGGKRYKAPRGSLKIIEVTYVGDPKWEPKVAATNAKYVSLVAELEALDWGVKCMVVVVTGMSRGFFSEEQCRGQGRALDLSVSILGGML